MQRRKFVASMIAGAGAGLAMRGNEMQAQASSSMEFYQLRKYTMRSGPQQEVTEKFFAEAMVPGLNRLGITSVGAFKLDIGPETPCYYLLIPSTSAETLVTLDLRLIHDAKFVEAAEEFWDAPAAAPAFQRVETSMLSAFSGWPKLVVPKQEKRVLQLRTYESASYATHQTKVKMFNEAEIGIFTKSGLAPVFFGSTLVGSRTPSLTYMLAFPDVATLTRNWNTFASDPAWKELSHRPDYADAKIVSNISNLYLSPLPSSQI